MRFGKYKGIDIARVPDDYLTWLMDTTTVWADTRAAASREWDRRYPEVVVETKLLLEFPPDLMGVAREMLVAGYRTCAKKYHPDGGAGNEELMKRVNLVMEIMNEAIGRGKGY
jgi:hypothetical protein